jgi:hypothetical protein
LEFGTLVIVIYLLFGAWCLEFDLPRHRRDAWNFLISVIGAYLLFGAWKLEFLK